MILTTWLLRIDFFEDVSDFYYFAVKFFVRDIITDFSSIAWFSSLEKNDFELTYGALIFVSIY